MSKILFFFFLFVCGSISAQLNRFDFDKECFLIGTLDNVITRVHTLPANADSSCFYRIDVNFQSRRDIALLIEVLFKNEFADLHIVDNGGLQGIELYSPSLSKIIDNYYDYDLTKSKTTPQGNLIHWGYLNINKIRTNQQKLSFLAGAFFRRGKRDYSQSSKFIYAMPNPFRTEVYDLFLKDLDCTGIKYSEHIMYPTVYEIAFTPSKRVQEMIDIVDNLKKEAMGVFE